MSHFLNFERPVLPALYKRVGENGKQGRSSFAPFQEVRENGNVGTLTKIMRNRFFRVSSHHEKGVSQCCHS